jgi:hypothetical protein
MKGKVTADLGQVQRLGDDYRRAARVGVFRLAERGEQLVREEAPEETRNLKQGVSSEVKGGRTSKSLGEIRGEIIVTARTGRLGRREATLHGPDGSTKKVSLRAVPSFNYPQAVAEGTGEFGPNKARIKPRKAKALLVPVNNPPTIDGKPASYIEADGKLYVMRRSMKGMKPNPYHERAGRRLEAEAQPIFDRALREYMGGKP